MPAVAATARWTLACRDALVARQRPDGGFGHSDDGPNCTETTALAILGLIATDPSNRQAAHGAGAWLAEVQGDHGAVGATAELSAPHWPTPLAILAWNALHGFEAQRDRAVKALLAMHGEASEDPLHIFGHDTRLTGWSWAAGTHSWIEPTAMAILALGGQGLGEHARVREGLQLLEDRAIPSGGWNYGNPAVFGLALRPQPGPTGLTLLALKRTRPQSPAIPAAVAYLQQALPEMRAAQSLALGVLGLTAFDARPVKSDAWLSESFLRAASRPDSTARFAYLLLAAGPSTLDLLLPNSRERHA